MEQRFPRGTLPPSQFEEFAAAARAGQRCDLTTVCPTCVIEMLPEHAHYKCPKCGYRDSCCF